MRWQGRHARWKNQSRHVGASSQRSPTVDRESEAGGRGGWPPGPWDVWREQPASHTKEEQKRTGRSKSVKDDKKCDKDAGVARPPHTDVTQRQR